MSEKLILLTERITLYEAGLASLMFLLIAAIGSIVILQLTDDRRLAVIFVLSNLVSTAISLLILLITYILPNILLHNMYYFVFIAPLALNGANMLGTSFEYARLLKEKRFDIDFVSRFYFSTSLQTSAVLIITALTLIAFIPREISFIISLSLLVILPTLTINNLLIRKYLK